MTEGGADPAYAPLRTALPWLVVSRLSFEPSAQGREEGPERLRGSSCCDRCTAGRDGRACWLLAGGGGGRLETLPGRVGTSRQSIPRSAPELSNLLQGRTCTFQGARRPLCLGRSSVPWALARCAPPLGPAPGPRRQKVSEGPRCQVIPMQLESDTRGAGCHPGCFCERSVAEPRSAFQVGREEPLPATGPGSY